MFRARLVLLGPAVMAMVVAATALASTASAINFEYRIEGKKLEAGSSKTITGSRVGTAVMKGTVAGAAIELLSNKGFVQSGANIKGGIPGTALEILELENVIVDKSPKCEISGKKITTVPLTSEIVEGASKGVGNGEVDVLSKPQSTNNEILTSFTFVNKGAEACSINGQTFNVTGLLLGLPLPQGTEVVKGAGDEEAVTKEYKNSKGEFKTAGLEFAGKPATLTGLVLVLLTTGEKGGVF
jgi:hypothetical protein